MNGEIRLEQPFSIHAKGPASRIRKTLKHNDTFAVVDSHGDIGAAAGGPDGLFDSDTRFLSHFELRISDIPPLLLGSNVREDNLHLYADLTNPDIVVGGSIILPKDSVHIARTIFLRDGTMHVRLAFANHSEQTVDLVASLDFDNDFADIFEVRGMVRVRRGYSRKRSLSDNHRLISYDGLDGRRRDTSIIFDPIPSRFTETRAAYDIHLRAKERCAFFVAISCRGAFKSSTREFFRGLRLADHEHKRAMQNVASVETSSTTLNEILCRSISDFYMLVTNTIQGPYPYAGIPWYSTTFGRDGIIAAMQILWLDPSIARGVLRRLAALQATTGDAVRDSQPGKILHEMRSGEMAALNEVPFGRYYGSIDATPLFIILAGLYCQRTGDIGLLSELWPNIERALSWIDDYGDIDGDGFVEYQRAAATGLSNQGWKDSFDSIFHKNGALAEGAIALVEVQAYTYAAKSWASNCARQLGHADRARELDIEAEQLRSRFEQTFWLDHLDTYALALDGSKKPCEVRASNAHHTLFCGIASPARAARLVNALLKHDFNCGWGIRTLAKGEPRYNPMSYHNGSVWPHDNAIIAAGLGRYG